MPIKEDERLGRHRNNQRYFLLEGIPLEHDSEVIYCLDCDSNCTAGFERLRVIDLEELDQGFAAFRSGLEVSLIVIHSDIDIKDFGPRKLV